MKTAKRIIVVIGFLGILFGGDESDPDIEKSLAAGINLTQAGFDNWVAGGEGSYAWQSNLDFKYKYTSEKIVWSNTGKIAYGSQKTGEKPTQKSIDELKFESVATYQLGSSINPFVAIVGETQLDAGYDYSVDPAIQISAFLDPGYFRESFGAGFELNPNLTTRIGLSMKQSITSDFPAPFADDPATTEIEKIKSEFGAESVSDIILKVSDNTEYSSKLEIFTAFSSLDETDLRWDNSLTVKLSEYFNVNINMIVVYDKDISAKRQIKQATALGLNYSFF